MNKIAVQTIDLNADLGEGFGQWSKGDDEVMLNIVTSANVACGMHAGDPEIMARTFALAKERGVAVGAHPGYPDLWGFGRRNLPFSPGEIERFVAYHIGAAQALSAYAGHPISYVKPHGALGNLTQVDEAVARAVVNAITAVDNSLILLTFADGCAHRLAKEKGLKTATEIFADRAYGEDGRLLSRAIKGSVIHDPVEIAARILRMVKAGAIETASGKLLPTPIDSICVHGDTPGAAQIAEGVKRALIESGIRIAPFATPTA